MKLNPIKLILFVPGWFLRDVGGSHAYAAARAASVRAVRYLTLDTPSRYPQCRASSRVVRSDDKGKIYFPFPISSFGVYINST